ncbi:portal protein [Haloarcula californiae tailed virus 2]|uniref:Portal protein n=1 Tax=Haloarcula californiae tailed virus 2 TaxID=1273747 RepID=R4TM49_9CAUD|nr:portal protein [Haloarcula californiae tailed virus 2]AGM11797.1 hypothetical protein HCTV2_23 [Haloarcula californiae tailed virus 2]
MSRWDQALNWLRNPVSSTVSSGQRSRQEKSGYAPGHEPPRSGDRPQRGLVDRQKQRREQAKREVDRKVGLPPELQREVERRDGQPKPYDAAFLAEIAQHPVAQAYIDTMAQDAATAPWSITQRDERIEVDDTVLADVERTLEDLHPEKSFRDLREMAARNTLKLGDGAWVLHFYSGSQELAEAIPVDTQRLYKVVDEHGITQGYIEVSHRNRAVTNEYALEEVAWFEWSSRPSGVYGQGPVEKGVEVLEVLEELSDKEIKDLEEGMPPGIVSVKEDEDTPMAVDAYENVKDNWELKEGERHRAIVSMGDWQFTPLSPGYQELQFLERNKFWIQALGAVFKVNAPYAGFDFQEGNKAQNQAQAAAYAQRGFRVLLRQMQEAINRQVIWPHLSEDVQFEFETEQTPEEQQAHAEYLQALGDAAEQWDNLGRDVTFRDGSIEVEDGEVDAPEDTGDEGMGGGIFGSTQAGTRKAVDLAAPAGREAVSSPDLEQWREFREDVALLDGQIEDAETGRTFPEHDLAPASTLTVHGLEQRVVEALLSRYDALEWRVRGRDEQHAGGKEQDKSEGDTLTKEQARKADDLLLEAHKSQIWPEDLEAIEKRTWTGDESVPEYVVKNIQEAINRAGAVFSDIESVPDDAVKRLEGILEENLTQPQGWSLDSIVEDMSDAWPGVGKEDLEVVARTETASVLNEAREIGYESMPDSGQAKFYWQGPSDSRTTEACEELKEETNPQYGGTPVSMNELVRLEQEVQEQHFTNLSFRKHTVHPNERHTFVRQVDALVDEGGF